jgi:hypothetical protein
MTLRRAIRALPAALVLCAGHALGQVTSTDVPAQTAVSSPAPANGEAERAWAFSAYLYGYILPDSPDYLQPTVTADRGWLHLEARYNYEAPRTGSVWVGYNFSVGKEVTLDFIPMLGGVFGDTNGIAPGYTFTLSWWKLQLYSQGEYVIDTGSSSDSFFYTWSELTMAPAEWFRFGFVVQRTKLYQTDFDIQRGVLVGFTWKKANFTAYVFNPDASKPVFVLALGLNF